MLFSFLYGPRPQAWGVYLWWGVGHFSVGLPSLTQTSQNSPGAWLEVNQSLIGMLEAYLHPG